MVISLVIFAGHARDANALHCSCGVPSIFSLHFLCPNSIAPNGSDLCFFLDGGLNC